MAKRTLWGFLLILALLNGCESSIGIMKKEVEQVTKEINEYFVYAREAAEKIAYKMEELLKNKDKYDLSIDKMDYEKGGKYRFYEKTMYYKATNDGGAAFCATGAIAVNNEIKRRIRLLENMEPLLKKISREAIVYFILGQNTLGMSYPFIDFISSLPPKLDYRKFPWYYLADEKHNPEKRVVWMDFPFVVLHGGGWVCDVLKPVYYKNKLEAVVCNEVYLTTLARKFFQNKDSILLLVTGQSSVIGASPMARKELKIKVLREYEYLQQIKENRFVQEEYNLTYKDNPSDIQELGRRISNEKYFDITINGKRYYVYKSALPEQTNLMIIGLSRK